MSATFLTYFLITRGAARHRVKVSSTGRYLSLVIVVWCAKHPADESERGKVDEVAQSAAAHSRARPGSQRDLKRNPTCVISGKEIHPTTDSRLNAKIRDGDPCVTADENTPTSYTLPAAGGGARATPHKAKSV